MKTTTTIRVFAYPVTIKDHRTGEKSRDTRINYIYNFNFIFNYRINIIINHCNRKRKKTEVRMRYKECPYCGAALDPGERCDCQENRNSKSTRKTRKKKAAPVRQHRNGKVKVTRQTTITTILPNKEEDCQG